MGGTDAPPAFSSVKDSFSAARVLAADHLQLSAPSRVALASMKEMAMSIMTWPSQPYLGHLSRTFLAPELLGQLTEAMAGPASQLVSLSAQSHFIALPFTSVGPNNTP